MRRGPRSELSGNAPMSGTSKLISVSVAGLSFTPAASRAPFSKPMPKLTSSLALTFSPASLRNSVSSWVPSSLPSLSVTSKLLASFSSGPIDPRTLPFTLTFKTPHVIVASLTNSQTPAVLEVNDTSRTSLASDRVPSAEPEGSHLLPDHEHSWNVVVSEATLCVVALPPPPLDLHLPSPFAL